MNFRSLKVWDLLIDEMIQICENCGVTGFYFGLLKQWDNVIKRDLKELGRIDPDGTPHYDFRNFIDGAIVSSHKKISTCGMSQRKFKSSPFLSRVMRKLWSRCNNIFAWLQCEPEKEPFVINSGIIPSNYAFRTVFQTAIDHSIHNNNVDYVNANENLINFYNERKQRNPEGSFNICPFGALTDGPYNIPLEGLTLAIDILFYLTDVPLISGCLDTAMFYVNAYGAVKYDYEERKVDVYSDESDFEDLEEEEEEQNENP